VSNSINSIADPGFLSLRTGTQDAMLVREVGSSQFLRAVTANLAGASGSACSGSTPTILTGSCAHAAAYRSVGTVTVLDPTGAVGAPAGFAGLLHVDGLTETAISESGRGARAIGTAGFTPYTRAGTLYWWNSATSSYQTVDLSTFAGTGTATNITLPPMTLTYPDGLTVTASGSVVVNHVAQTNIASAGCTTTCSTSVDGSSVVRALITITATRGADSSTFGLSADLGGLIASSSFKAAAGA
jgi:hypothetical protein